MNACSYLQDVRTSNDDAVALLQPVDVSAAP